MGLDKRRRIHDRHALTAARRPYCEYCGLARGPFETHHIKSRGAGGDDVEENLINLCVGPKTNDCHGRAHRGLIPRHMLEDIVRRRKHSG